MSGQCFSWQHSGLVFFRHELFGRGRASCEPESGLAALSDCECEESWQYTAGQCYGETSHMMRGCPTLDELAVCEPGLESSWCETTDALCRGQHGDEVGSGWVTCDPGSQRAVPEGAGGSDGPDGTSTAAIIAASVGVTLIVVATTTILVLAYHKHGGYKPHRVRVSAPCPHPACSPPAAAVAATARRALPFPTLGQRWACPIISLSGSHFPVIAVANAFAGGGYILSTKAEGGRVKRVKRCAHNPRIVQGSHQNQSTTAKLMDHGDSYRTPPRGMFGGRTN